MRICHSNNQRNTVLTFRHMMLLFLLNITLLGCDDSSNLRRSVGMSDVDGTWKFHDSTTISVSSNSHIVLNTNQSYSCVDVPLAIFDAQANTIVSTSGTWELVATGGNQYIALNDGVGNNMKRAVGEIRRHKNGSLLLRFEVGDPDSVNLVEYLLKAPIHP